MMTGEMTDNEVRQRVERADRFIEQLRDAITAPTSPSLRPTNKPSSEPDLISNHQCRLWVQHGERFRPVRADQTALCPWDRQGD
jgi:hypothetical protein